MQLKVKCYFCTGVHWNKWSKSELWISVVNPNQMIIQWSWKSGEGFWQCWRRLLNVTLSKTRELYEERKLNLQTDSTKNALKDFFDKHFKAPVTAYIYFLNVDPSFEETYFLCTFYSLYFFIQIHTQFFIFNLKGSLQWIEKTYKP